jgi:hypothetical protein
MMPWQQISPGWMSMWHQRRNVLSITLIRDEAQTSIVSDARAVRKAKYEQAIRQFERRFVLVVILIGLWAVKTVAGALLDGVFVSALAAAEGTVRWVLLAGRFLTADPFGSVLEGFAAFAMALWTMLRR